MAPPPTSTVPPPGADGYMHPRLGMLPPLRTMCHVVSATLWLGDVLPEHAYGDALLKVISQYAFVTYLRLQTQKGMGFVKFGSRKDAEMVYEVIRNKIPLGDLPPLVTKWGQIGPKASFDRQSGSTYMDLGSILTQPDTHSSPMGGFIVQPQGLDHVNRMVNFDPIADSLKHFHAANGYVPPNIVHSPPLPADVGGKRGPPSAPAGGPPSKRSKGLPDPRASAPADPRAAPADPRAAPADPRAAPADPRAAPADPRDPRKR